MRRLIVALVISFAAPLIVSSCATSSSIQAEAVDAGTPQDFAAPYEVVKAAALESVERMNVNVQGSDETPERFQVRFSKPISGFSWGEVGTVNVVRIDEHNSRVYVHSQKRDRMQVTGTTEQQFATHVFANIQESLARLQPQ